MSADSALDLHGPTTRAMLAPHHSRTGSSGEQQGITVAASDADEAAAQRFSQVSV
ncbi:hypothetical protein ACIF80_00650 [Streptomyces sp. NPDC085927]|uniref:hypothetical protein n=1 Tax=Streptomyces sp. NPDC085927 TaxID=3365738 RepID=UPI0037D0B707